jgi:hypothetical protein
MYFEYLKDYEPHYLNYFNLTIDTLKVNVYFVTNFNIF